MVVSTRAALHHACSSLQEELTKRGLDTKWNPLKGKKELVDRLQVGPAVLLPVQ